MLGSLVISADVSDAGVVSVAVTDVSSVVSEVSDSDIFRLHPENKARTRDAAKMVALTLFIFL